MAERTGLEPAAFAVTGRRYSQLNYRSTLKERKKRTTYVQRPLGIDSPQI